MLSLFTFRYEPAGAADPEALNLALVNAVNDDGRTYVTQTKVDGRIAIRIQVGSFDATEADIRDSWTAIREIAAGLPG